MDDDRIELAFGKSVNREIGKSVSEVTGSQYLQARRVFFRQYLLRAWRSPWVWNGGVPLGPPGSPSVEAHTLYSSTEEVEALSGLIAN